MNAPPETRLGLKLHPERCTGCLSCLLACTLHHEGSCSVRWARLVVTDTWDGEAFEIDVCRHCEEAPCMAACEYGALFEREGIVALDRGSCTSCGACADACSYGAIFFDPEEEKALKCDLCGGVPRCVTYCETVALEFDAPDARFNGGRTEEAPRRLGWPS